MSQFERMTGKKLIAISWWTFAYAILAGALFTFSAMGDCLPGKDGVDCRAESKALTDALLMVEVLAYPLLTWLMFFRRH